VKIGVYPADLSGCGHYRIIWPAQAAQSAGVDVTIEPVGRLEQLPLLSALNPTNGRRRVVMAQPPAYDVVVIQRPVSFRYAGAIPIWQQQGVKVVVDLDDDLAALDPSHVGFVGYHPSKSPNENWRLLIEACAAADRVTVTTKALADRYRSVHGDVRIIPNGVPAHFLNVDVAKLRNTIAWTGTTATHPGDLRVVGNAMARLLRTRPWRIRVVGPGDGVAADLGVMPAKVEAMGWTPILDYPAAMAAHEIGIVPLRLTPFNAAKSWLKMLEFAALGVPAVASPTDPNQLLFYEGAGVLAVSPAQWGGRLSDLTDDPLLRADLAAKGRQVAAQHTIEGNAQLWVDAWTDW
jgi:glycosyltransferase involved in cell wall biosynthesis